jgi:hypothetical protein
MNCILEFLKISKGIVNDDKLPTAALKKEKRQKLLKKCIIIMIPSISFYSLGGIKEIFKRKANINPVTVVKSPLSFSIELHISIISCFAIFHYPCRFL